jgi:hypothetical protein
MVLVMSEKAVGYSLLTIGLLVIAFAAFSVYQVFTKQASPVQLFSFNNISIDVGQMLGGGVIPQGATKPTEILSANMINDTSNVFAHLFLMGFVASIGQKIANIGVNLVRTIKVEIKTKEVPVETHA